MKSKGFVDKRFEPVQKAFEKLLNSGCEDNLQLCVYLDAECVIDLFGSAKNDEKYSADSIQCIFSSGKTIASIVIAQLVEQNLLDYEEKVAKYWPEFGKNGKEEITLADVLRHESGLSWFDHTFNKDDFLTENIKVSKSKDM